MTAAAHQPQQDPRSFSSPSSLHRAALLTASGEVFDPFDQEQRWAAPVSQLHLLPASADSACRMYCACGRLLGLACCWCGSSSSSVCLCFPTTTGGRVPPVVVMCVTCRSSGSRHKQQQVDRARAEEHWALCLHRCAIWKLCWPGLATSACFLLRHRQR